MDMDSEAVPNLQAPGPPQCHSCLGFRGLGVKGLGFIGFRGSRF